MVIRAIFLETSSFLVSEKIFYLLIVNLVMDKIANRPRGFAFLCYSTEDESQKAIEGMHGKVCNWCFCCEKLMHNMLMMPTSGNLGGRVGYCILAFFNKASSLKFVS